MRNQIGSCAVLIFLVILSETKSAPRCDFKAIFQTPQETRRRNFDGFEILERSNFPESEVNTEINQNQQVETPKSYANAQIMLRFGGDCKKEVQTATSLPFVPPCGPPLPYQSPVLPYNNVPPYFPYPLSSYNNPLQSSYYPLNYFLPNNGRYVSPLPPYQNVYDYRSPVGTPTGLLSTNGQPVLNEPCKVCRNVESAAQTQAALDFVEAIKEENITPLCNDPHPEILKPVDLTNECVPEKLIPVVKNDVKCTCTNEVSPCVEITDTKSKELGELSQLDECSGNQKIIQKECKNRSNIMVLTSSNAEQQLSSVNYGVVEKGPSNIKTIEYIAEGNELVKIETQPTRELNAEIVKVTEYCPQGNGYVKVEENINYIPYKMPPYNVNYVPVNTNDFFQALTTKLTTPNPNYTYQRLVLPKRNPCNVNTKRENPDIKEMLQNALVPIFISVDQKPKQLITYPIVGAKTEEKEEIIILPDKLTDVEIQEVNTCSCCSRKGNVPNGKRFKFDMDDLTTFNGVTVNQPYNNDVLQQQQQLQRNLLPYGLGGSAYAVSSAAGYVSDPTKTILYQQPTTISYLERDSATNLPITVSYVERNPSLVEYSAPASLQSPYQVQPSQQYNPMYVMPTRQLDLANYYQNIMVAPKYEAIGCPKCRNSNTRCAECAKYERELNES